MTFALNSTLDRVLATGLILVLAFPCGFARAAQETGEVSGGSARYSIAIEVPDSEKTYHPVVSVNYSSRRGNGSLGMGWSFWGGQSAVHRCPATVAMDGFDQEVDYTSTDKLCIEGQHMLLVRGLYGKDGSTYRAEIESGVMVTLHGDVNAPDAWFEAIRGDGGRDVFDERNVPRGAPAALYWYVTRRESSERQAIEYDYLRTETGDSLLRRIRYVGQPSPENGKRERYFVEFDYAHRSDVSSELLSGGETRQTKYLRRILSGQAKDTGDRISHEYRFSYRPSQSTGRLLLQQAIHCVGAGDGGNCNKPTKVQWLDRPIVFSEPRRVKGPSIDIPLAPAWRPGSPVPRLGGFFESSDFDADGRSEIFERRSNGSATVWRIDLDGKSARGTVVDEAATFLPNFAEAYIGRDLRSIGGSDLLGKHAGRMAAISWRGDGFATPVTIDVPESSDMISFDVDNDGRRDLLEGRRDGSRYRVFLHKNIVANDRELRYRQAEPIAELETDIDPRLKIGYGIHGMGRAVVLADGNNLLRFLLFATDEDGKLKHALVDPVVYGMRAEALRSRHLFADINGDGMSEVVYAGMDRRLMVQLNTGKGFAPPVDVGIADPRLDGTAMAASVVADYNGDGKDEILFPANRLVDFCVRDGDAAPICSDTLSRTNPEMDIGIYGYDAIRFSLDVDGRFSAEQISGLGIVAQANRMAVDNLHGDHVEDYFSAFDRGVENGWFVDVGGSLTECPPKYGCGLHVISVDASDRRDRRDTGNEKVSSIVSSRGEKFSWHYFPLSSEKPNFYSVPAIDAENRYLGEDRFYFRSSMYVVGEFRADYGAFALKAEYRYGGAAYNSQGRGFTGFQWISVINGNGRRSTSWYRQEFPYWGELEHEWVEFNSDNEGDYVNASPGKRFISRQSHRLTCYGPAGHELTRRFGCKVHGMPGFSVKSTPIREKR